MSAIETRVTQLIEDSLQHIGYDIVRVKLLDGRRRTLQIMIDRLDEGQITVRDCEKASRVISAIIDVEDPISGEYNLEVSSPGIDRPLVRLKDFERFKGLEAKISLYEPQNGRKHFTGRIIGVEGEDISLKLSEHEEPVTLQFAAISTAKLVLNDELLELAKLQQSKQ